MLGGLAYVKIVRAPTAMAYQPYRIAIIGYESTIAVRRLVFDCCFVLIVRAVRHTASDPSVSCDFDTLEGNNPVKCVSDLAFALDVLSDRSSAQTTQFKCAWRCDKR
jgi:hypothetical protein